MARQIVFLSTGAIVLAAVAASMALAGNRDPQKTSSRLTVTASFYPLYDFARHVGGDKVQVVDVTPAGSEPHDYEPTPKQLVEAGKSDVFIYNGTAAAMEPWVDKFVPDYRHIVVKASNGIKPQQDPHFWLDPVLAERIVTNIRDGLVKADPQNADYFNQQAQAYNAKLAVLDHDYRSGLADCETRTIVTSHDAFSYLGKRYKLDVVSIAGITPDAEPSAAKLAELTDLVRAKHIKYVFFESLVSPRLAETVARETGAKTAIFDPIEGVNNADQKKGKDYLSIQRQNLANLRLALSCR